MALALDNHGVNFNVGSPSPGTVTLGTIAAGARVVISFVVNTQTVTSVTDNGPGYTWMSRGTVSSGNNIAVYWADDTSNALSGKTISVAFTGGGSPFWSIRWLSITGIGAGGFTGNGPRTSGSTFTTDYAVSSPITNAFIYSFSSGDLNSGYGAGSGWTVLDDSTTDFCGTQYRIETGTAVTNSPYSGNTNTGTLNRNIVDGVTDQNVGAPVLMGQACL